MHVHRVFVTKYRETAERYDVLCSPGYFAASCGGAPISIVRHSVEQQQAPDEQLTPCSPDLKTGLYGAFLVKKDKRIRLLNAAACPAGTLEVNHAQT